MNYHKTVHEFKMEYRFRSNIVFLALAFAQSSLVNTEPVCETDECLASSQLLKRSINPLIHPCDDFYKYACGNWHNTHPIFSKFIGSSTTEERRYRNILELLNFMRKNNSNEEPAAVHEMRKLFSLCENTDKIDRKGLQPLINILHEIGISLPPSMDFDLVATTTKASRQFGLDIFYNIGVSPNPFNQSVNRISINKPFSNELQRIPLFRRLNLIRKRVAGSDESSLSMKNYMEMVFEVLCKNLNSTQWCTYLFKTDVGIERLFELRQYVSNLATVISKLYPETKATSSKEYSLKYLQNMTDDLAGKNEYQIALNWTRHIHLMTENIENVTVDLSKPEEFMVVFEEPYVKDILKFIYSYNSTDHELGMVWTVADTLALYTGYELRNIKQNYSSDLTDTSSRSMWCTNTVSQILGMAAGYYYATHEKYNNIKEKVRIIVSGIHNELTTSIMQAAWIDSITKDRALKKLKHMKKLVAFPSTLSLKNDLDTYYQDLQITDDFMDTVLQKARKDILKEFRSLNVINDLNLDRRVVTPAHVNAYYDPERNSIIIPAGILGFPIHGHGLESLNYGFTGSIIGHEISHGFDIEGRLYDYLGNMKEWWQIETLEKFQNKSSCFLDAYKNYSTTHGNLLVTTDSLITLTENIADNVGFKQALRAYRNYISQNGEEPRLKNFENMTNDQLLTLGFANLWCENPTYFSAYMSTISEHSPNPIRVNGVVMNSAEFSKIWNCEKGTNMNPRTSNCELW